MYIKYILVERIFENFEEIFSMFPKTRLSFLKEFQKIIFENSQPNKFWKLLCKTNSEAATEQRRFGLPQKIIVELDIDYLITGNWHKDEKFT